MSLVDPKRFRQILCRAQRCGVEIPLAASRQLRISNYAHEGKTRGLGHGRAPGLRLRISTGSAAIRSDYDRALGEHHASAGLLGFR